MSKVAWLFLIHDVMPSWVKAELQPIQTRWFRKWLGYPKRGANVSIFYRYKEHHGLQLRETTAVHKEQRLIRRHILSQSKDPIVKAIHDAVSTSQGTHEKGAWKDCMLGKIKHKKARAPWRDCKVLRGLEHEMEQEKMRGALQQKGAGIGWGVRKVRPQSQVKEERQAILRICREITEQERITYVISNLKYFGEWVKWGAAMQLDSRYHNLLAYHSDSSLRFRLCATEDVLPTESVRNVWGIEGASGMCSLCGQRGSLLHILTQCRIDEKPQSPQKWRHDSVLLAIFRAAKDVLERVKQSREDSKSGTQKVAAPVSTFVSAGELVQDKDGSLKEPEVVEGGAVRKLKSLQTPQHVALLERADDWKVHADLNAPEYGQMENTLFPPEIVPTAERPDLVIWSSSIKTVIWVELTSPWEENMEENHFYKKSRYNDLALACQANDWKVHDLCVEVGCRGYVNCHGWKSMIDTLSFTRGEARRLKWIVEDTALHCSHAIFAQRKEPQWIPKPLMDVTSWHRNRNSNSVTEKRRR